MPRCTHERHSAWHTNESIPRLLYPQSLSHEPLLDLRLSRGSFLSMTRRYYYTLVCDRACSVNVWSGGYLSFTALIAGIGKNGDAPQHAAQDCMMPGTYTHVHEKAAK